MGEPGPHENVARNGVGGEQATAVGSTKTAVGHQARTIDRQHFDLLAASVDDPYAVIGRATDVVVALDVDTEAIAGRGAKLFDDPLPVAVAADLLSTDDLAGGRGRAQSRTSSFMTLAKAAGCDTMTVCPASMVRRLTLAPRLAAISSASAGGTGTSRLMLM
jgi:hypothetical protein